MELAPQTERRAVGTFSLNLLIFAPQAEWPLADSFRVSVTNKYFEEFMTQLNEKILARWEF